MRKIKDAFKHLPSSEIEHLIDEWIHSRRDRNVLKLALLDDLTYEEISGEVSMSTQQVKTITSNGVKDIKMHMIYSL